jgi:hypothetical protein
MVRSQEEGSGKYLRKAKNKRKAITACESEKGVVWLISSPKRGDMRQPHNLANLWNSPQDTQRASSKRAAQQEKRTLLREKHILLSRSEVSLGMIPRQCIEVQTSPVERPSVPPWFRRSRYPLPAPGHKRTSGGLYTPDPPGARHIRPVLATWSIRSRNRLMEMKDQVSLSLQMA